MYGVEIPKDPKQVRILDQQNKNSHWQDAEYSEIQQLMDYNFAKDTSNGDLKPLDNN